MKLISKYINLLLIFHRKKQNISYKLFALCCGILFFLGVLPFLLSKLAHIVFVNFKIPVFKVESWLSFIVGITGLLILTWTVITQWRVGKGTPALIAPTKKLIISGPYKYTRNPIELGAILYYFAFGTICYNWFNGLFCFVVSLIAGSTYHKFIEERELEARFGEEYKQYKKKVPFLFPDFLFY
ncbi:MAG: isoprenylcysteine carboxylmethyltransferase family protein [bacterium]|nr:isoprenylcysteine carboxylmethyltransferase family protein [bacterium]